MTTKTFNITAAPAGAVPTWWSTNFNPGSWKSVAASGTLFSALYPDQDQYTAAALGWPSYGGDPRARALGFMADYGGGCTDATRREYLFVALGGHADYVGNEAYALALWHDTPYWYRINDPTPATVMGQLPQPGDPGVEADGRCRSMHTYGLPVHVGGKTWFPYQGFVRSPGGVMVNAVACFNREATGVFSNATSPLAWANNAGQWTLRSLNNTPNTLPAGNVNTYINASAKYESATGFIYCVNSGNAEVFIIKVDPSYPDATSSAAHSCHSLTANGGNPPYLGPRLALVAIPDRTVAGGGDGVLMWFNGSSPNTLTFCSAPKIGTGSGSAIWVNRTCSGGPAEIVSGTYSDVAGGYAVYHNGAVYYMDWGRYGSTIWKLPLPADLATGSLVWTQIATHATNPADVQAKIPIGQMSASMHGNFNIIPDMGDGVAALVCASQWNAATYVYKIPVV